MVNCKHLTCKLFASFVFTLCRWEHGRPSFGWLLCLSFALGGFGFFSPGLLGFCKLCTFDLYIDSFMCLYNCKFVMHISSNYFKLVISFYVLEDCWCWKLKIVLNYGRNLHLSKYNVDKICLN
ncbi:hypothetical protein Pint_34541 [Pistacia integerrima]|uniref:Uncharacterized protein n=1 Tax=Pistacia integerrima TaxID=434235 RepID=A0ACC0X764_9ROSI|nr:hypothetical protein Pint_34541 [Pistacia integerrima]